jgi:hypothetical protein
VPRSGNREQRGGVLVIVARGCPELYQQLKSLEDRARITVLCDRRVQERRGDDRPVPVDRRATERRRRPPSPWETLGVLLIRPEAPTVPGP